jgi:hypothetical protein
MELSSHSLSAWVAVCGIQSLVGFGLALVELDHVSPCVPFGATRP